jgi:hypothetical protein
MSKHQITSTITGDLFSVLLLLEGEPIDLNYNGANMYSSTNTVEVIGRLNIVCIVRGLVGTEWTLKLSAGASDLFSETRTIEFGNRDILSDTVDVTTLLTAAKKGAAKKGGSKKGGS